LALSNQTKSVFRKSPAQKHWLGSVDYGHNNHGEVGRRNPATLVTRTLKRCCSVVPSRSKTLENPNLRPTLRSRHMMQHVYRIDEDVFRQADGPQGRDVIERSNIYTILALLPVEADGRLRYRIKSKEENFERIVTEEVLSRLN
jgi:hypothetical protein